MATKLYITNLNEQTTDQQLYTLFSEAGAIVSSHMITSSGTGESCGSGLVEMATEAQAQHAIQSMHGRSVAGHLLQVSFAPDRAPGWEGGNNQRGRNRSHGFGPGNGGSLW